MSSVVHRRIWNPSKQVLHAGGVIEDLLVLGLSEQTRRAPKEDITKERTGEWECV